MKSEYEVKSERYGRTHKFISTSNGSNPYIFVPEEEWMPLYCTYNKDGTILAIDTEGGPFIVKGWSNDEITVEKIDGGKTGPIYFTLKENE